MTIKHRVNGLHNVSIKLTKQTHILAELYVLKDLEEVRSFIYALTFSFPSLSICLKLL